jgi:hypothetical protein
MTYGGYSEVPTMPDRLISAGSYMTMGLVGFVWLIVVSLQKGVLKTFLKYHIFQSIFITVLVAIFNILIGIFLKYALLIPVAGDVVALIVGFLTMVVFGDMSIIHLLFSLIVLYFAITALLGKYSYFPWISDNVRQLVGNMR